MSNGLFVLNTLSCYKISPAECRVISLHFISCICTTFCIPPCQHYLAYTWNLSYDIFQISFRHYISTRLLLWQFTNQIHKLSRAVKFNITREKSKLHFSKMRYVSQINVCFVNVIRGKAYLRERRIAIVVVRIIYFSRAIWNVNSTTRK